MAGPHRKFPQLFNSLSHRNVLSGKKSGCISDGRLEKAERKTEELAFRKKDPVKSPERVQMRTRATKREYGNSRVCVNRYKEIIVNVREFYTRKSMENVKINCPNLFYYL